MSLFLQGSQKIGKSTILKKALSPYAHMTAGFVTQRLLKNGENIGFRVCVFEGELPPIELNYSVGIDGVFILNGKMDVSKLEEAITRVSIKSQKDLCKLVLLDEIGGIELKSGIFMETLITILNGQKPCAGVLKSAENLIVTLNSLNLEDEFISRRYKLEETIREKGALITVTNENINALPERITSFAKFCLK